MKKITTNIMLIAALVFGFIACKNETKKAEETTTEGTHSENDGHNHNSESKDVHLHDTLHEGHEGHDHAAGDTSKTHKHNH